jgi:hypothetical protein
VIGIEPMNKGFAVLKNVLLQVWSYAELCFLFASPQFLVRVRWPDFGPVAPGCVTPVTQIQGIPGGSNSDRRRRFQQGCLASLYNVF